MSWINDKLQSLEVWWYTRKLKSFIMYKNEKYNVYLMLNPDDKLLQVFIGGLLFKIPIDIEVTDNASRGAALDKISDINLDQNTIEDLKSILSIYEDDEDFEKCKEIQDIINKKLNEKT